MRVRKIGIHLSIKWLQYKCMSELIQVFCIVDIPAHMTLSYLAGFVNLKVNEGHQWFVCSNERKGSGWLCIEEMPHLFRVEQSDLL